MSKKNMLNTRLKVLDFFQKYGMNIVFIISVVIMVLFFCVHIDGKFDGIIGEYNSTGNMHLSSGTIYKQEINIAQDCNISGVSLNLGTYGRSNIGTLKVGLYVSDELVESWDVDTTTIEDNSYLDFELSKLLQVDKGDSLYIEFSQMYEGENGLVIWTCNNSNNFLYENGKLLEGVTSCFKLVYENIILEYGAIFFSIVISAIIVVTVLLHVNEKIIMSAILIVTGIIYMLVFPAGSAPDEVTHWLRAYEVSSGSFISEHIGESGVGGNQFPIGILEFSDENAELDRSGEQEFTFGNTALYAPLSYLPQSIGILIGDLITDNVSAIFLAGKWGNFFVAMFLCCSALFIAPFGHKLLFMIMMFPMSMQEMVSLAPDGFVIALSMFFIAYILKLTYQVDVVKKKDIVILAIVCILISLCKIVYIALLLLIFMIPNSKLGDKKQWISVKFGIIGLAVILNLIWLVISSGFMIEFRPGVSSGDQVIYVLTDLFGYVETIIATVIEKGVWYIQTMFGSSMGALCIDISPITWMIFLIVFVYEIGRNRECDVVPQKIDRWVVLLTFLGGAALIFTSLYVQWTPYASEIVDGVQGRYFIPFIGLLGLFVILTNREKSIENKINGVLKETPSYFYFILLLINGITILDIINYYI